MGRKHFTEEQIAFALRQAITTGRGIFAIDDSLSDQARRAAEALLPGRGVVWHQARLRSAATRMRACGELAIA